MKKNNDMKKNKLITKMSFYNGNDRSLDFDALKMEDVIERKLNELPVLTEAELDGLKAKADAFGYEVAEKGCWMGLGMFRREEGEPKLLVQADGNVTILALMVAEAMEHYPALEDVFLKAVGLKMKYGEDNNEDNEDKNEDCEENQRGIVWKDTTH